MPVPTNVDDFLGELDVGILKDNLSKVLSDVAMNVVNNHQKGNIKLSLVIEPPKNSEKVKVTAKLEYRRPTLKGGIGEDFTSSTEFYVNKGGRLSVLDEHQEQLAFGEDETVTAFTKPAEPDAANYR